MRIQRQLKCPRVAACYARGGGVLAIEPRKVISSARGPVWRRPVAVVAAGCPDRPRMTGASTWSVPHRRDHRSGQMRHGMQRFAT